MQLYGEVYQSASHWRLDWHHGESAAQLQSCDLQENRVAIHQLIQNNNTLQSFTTIFFA